MVSTSLSKIWTPNQDIHQNRQWWTWMLHYVLRGFVLFLRCSHGRFPLSRCDLSRIFSFRAAFCSRVAPWSAGIIADIKKPIRATEHRQNQHSIRHFEANVVSVLDTSSTLVIPAKTFPGHPEKIPWCSGNWRHHFTCSRHGWAFLKTGLLKKLAETVVPWNWTKKCGSLTPYPPAGSPAAWALWCWFVDIIRIINWRRILISKTASHFQFKGIFYLMQDSATY